MITVIYVLVILQIPLSKVTYIERHNYASK